MEYRIKDVELQCDEGMLKVGGYINVTERESEMLYSKKRGKWFKEVMKRGVFESAISRAKEIPLLLEHNWDKQLATTRNNSLTLKEDQIGLRFDAVIDDENIYEQVKSGVINSCSFGFRALQEEIESINSRLEKRFVTGIELLEVSLVKNPAYVGSLVESRAYEEELEKEAEEVVVETPAEETVEARAEVTEEKEDEAEKVEDSEVNEEEAPAEEVEEAEDRSSIFEEAVEPQEEAVDVNEELKEVVDDLIEKKEEEIQFAEIQEQGVNEHLEYVKEEHKMIEENLEKTSNLLNLEVIKLRLDLLKLKRIKENI